MLLEPMLGTRNRVSEILNRRRGMSIEMIRALHEQLHIPAEVLIKPSKIPA
jgi:HTH-type transcriptional regulator/antitoxin HigA